MLQTGKTFQSDNMKGWEDVETEWEYVCYKPLG